MVVIVLTLTYIFIHAIRGSEIAKEVEGGVQLIRPGSVVLILPETLSFTLRRVHPAQECVGDFVICYEAKAVMRANTPKPDHYVNYWPACPADTCALMIHPSNANALAFRSDNDYVYGFFNDHSKLACPRKVDDNRENFTIKELPDCPVIVKGAKLPKKDSTSDGTSNAKWIIIICVSIIFFIFVIFVVGICVLIRFKNNPASVKSDARAQRPSKSAISPMTTHKRSPMNTPIETSQRIVNESP
uniref:Ephrin RBD domain-containing protein n=1 Tax=Panagrellus redivivus TaxID=6233 RepID=A0A7E4V030_PANRE